MTTGVVFAGGEMASFIPQNSDVNEITTSGFYDSNFARCAMSPGSGGVFFTSAPFTNPTTQAVISSLSVPLWFAYRVQLNAPFGQNPFFQVLSGATPVFQLLASGGGEGTLIVSQYWTGTNWVTIGSGTSVPNGTLQALALFVSTTSFQLYIGGVLNDSGSAAMSEVTAISGFKCFNPGNVIGFSEMMVADISLITYRLQTLPITGAGGVQNWIGPFGNIDGVVTNLGSFVYTPSAAEETIYEHSTTVFANIRGIAVTAFVSAGSGGPQHVELTLESGGTTAQSSQRAQSAGYAGNVSIWNTDPNTGQAWTQSAADIIQYGVTSQA
jgi:hypothetical protein